MTYPNNHHLDDVLLVFVSFCGGIIEANQSYEPLGTYFSLTQGDLANKTPDGKHNKWSNSIQWSRNRLVGDGYILPDEDIARGYWKLSEKGAREAINTMASFGEAALSRLQLVAKPIRDSWNQPFEL